MSKEELQSLKYEQANGEAQKTTANKNSDFEIPASEKHLVHVEIEVPQFDPNTGDRLSKPYVTSFYPKEFAEMEKEGAFLGRKVKIIHMPSDAPKDVKSIDPNATAKNEPNAGLGAIQAQNGIVPNSQDQATAIGRQIPGAQLTQGERATLEALQFRAKQEEDAKQQEEKKGSSSEDKKPEATKGKTLSQMNKNELLAKYKELWGEEGDKDATNAELKAAIEDKMAQNEEGQKGSSEASQQEQSTGAIVNGAAAGSEQTPPGGNMGTGQSTEPAK